MGSARLVAAQNSVGFIYFTLEYRIEESGRESLDLATATIGLGAAAFALCCGYRIARLLRGEQMIHFRCHIPKGGCRRPAGQKY